MLSASQSGWASAVATRVTVRAARRSNTHAPMVAAVSRASAATCAVVAAVHVARWPPNRTATHSASSVARLTATAAPPTRNRSTSRRAGSRSERRHNCTRNTPIVTSSGRATKSRDTTAS